MNAFGEGSSTSKDRPESSAGIFEEDAKLWETLYWVKVEVEVGVFADQFGPLSSPDVFVVRQTPEESAGLAESQDV